MTRRNLILSKTINGIPPYVYEAYEVVRKSGLTNMFDIESVRFHMYQFKLYDAIEWLECGQGYFSFSRYAQVMKGYNVWLSSGVK